MAGDRRQCSEDRAAKIVRFKQITEELLPARARDEHWPLRFDHCFKRICLDHAFGDVWYKHLKKPAERNIDGEALNRALACADELLHGSRELLAQRNKESLTLRGK